MNPLKMNKISTTLFLLALMAIVSFAGCRKNATQPDDSTTPSQDASATDSFEFSLKKDSCYYLMKTTGDMWPVMGLENKYSVQWPAEGMLSPEAERELLVALFGDSAATSFDEAAARWVGANEYEALFQEDLVESRKVGVLQEDALDMLCFDHVDSKIEENGNLVGFNIFYESYMGGAHGIYSCRILIYDRDAARMIHLADLVDTTNFGEVVVRAIEDLVVNQTVRECLYNEELLEDGFPVSTDFYIDSTRSTITLIYQVYEIAPYACGPQEVVLPIFWLSKHRELTPYAKEIFGEGCSL